MNFYPSEEELQLNFKWKILDIWAYCNREGQKHDRITRKRRWRIDRQWGGHTGKGEWRHRPLVSIGFRTSRCTSLLFSHFRIIGYCTRPYLHLKRVHRERKMKTPTGVAVERERQCSGSVGTFFILPDPLVRGSDPDSDPSIIKQK
jgi:hypothetical protein